MKGIVRICCGSVVLFTAIPLFGQIFNNPSESPSQNRPPDEDPRLIYYEAINRPSTDSSLSRVDITFRASYNFFIFVRNEKFTSLTDTSNYELRWPFIAKADVSMELLDHSGVSAARELAKETIGTIDPEPKKHRDESVEGIFSFTVPPGEYTIAFQINDLESNRQFLETSRKVTARNFAADTLELSDVLFVEPSDSPKGTSDQFVPVNLGGDARFGRNFEACLEFVYSGGNAPDVQLRYSLYKLEDKRSDTTFFARDSVLAGAISKATTFIIDRTETAYRYRRAESRSAEQFSVLVPVQGDGLTQGSYELRMTATDGKLTRTSMHPFNVRWVGIPRSLQDLDFAIEALEYIASKDEMSDLRAMFAKNRKELFNEFWKKRDPTPHTAYNEAMAEYYRRVDYAMETFGTVGIPNGFKTDRGKVYILYGQPTHTERALSPTAPPREVWEYQNLKKRFIFVDQSLNGNYKLVAEEGL